jgi:hypothetical protein
MVLNKIIAIKSLLKHKFSNQVHFDFQFDHGLLGFLELRHVDTEVGQVLLQVRIFNLKDFYKVELTRDSTFSLLHMSS